MGKGDSPRPPPYERLIKLTERRMEASDDLARRFMQFQRQAYNDQEGRASDLYDLQRPAIEAAAQLSTDQIARYREMGIPLEDEFAQRLQDWDSPERRAQNAATAMGDIDTAMNRERDNAVAKLASYGIDPSQVRATGLDTRLGVAVAAEKAQAGTQARLGTEAQGIANIGQAADIYRGLPQVSAESLRSASGAASGALGGTLGAGQFGQQGWGQASDMYGAGSNTLFNGYNVANSIYGNALQGHQADMANSPAAIFGEVLGTAIPFLEEGGFVPPELSPSKGAIPDDIPAMVTANEYVIPREVVEYHGRKAFDKLIEVAHEKMGIPA